MGKKKTKPAGEPAPGSPEDLGYNGAKGEKPLDPGQQRQLVRLAREINRATKDVDAKASERGAASQALQAAQKGLKKLVAEQNAVVSGTWSEGMFDGDDEKPDADDGEDGNEE